MQQPKQPLVHPLLVRLLDFNLGCDALFIAPLQVFNTHTCANYAHTYAPAVEGVPWVAATDLDAPIRVAQVLQLARFVRALQETVRHPPRV